MRYARLAAFLLIVTASFWLFKTVTRARTSAVPSSAAAKRVLYYQDPMHPAYTSDRPGKAPDCGMVLQPVYAEDATASKRDGTRLSPIIEVSQDRQQLIGLRTGRSERTTGRDRVRTIGRVVADENRVFPLMAAASGWVTRIEQGAATGSRVRRGQPLVVVSGRDFTTAQRTYLYALRAVESRPTSTGVDPTNPQELTLLEAERALRGMGFGSAQIKQLAATRQAALDVTLTAPSDGVIVARSVFPQQRFAEDAELFRIADLSRVWIDADVFVKDEALVRTAAKVSVTLPGQQGSELDASLTDALPRFDRGARTMSVRLQADNPRLLLRPDMVVDLQFPVTLPEATTVPADAVVDSGLRRTVFVDRGGGHFEPRTVETGWRLGNRVQILRGLDPGESIVVSGSFLLDSESRIRLEGAREHD